jgi:hypothetical protein
MPYIAIGIGWGLLMGVWVFIEAESVKGRALILAIMLALFSLPIIWRRPAASLVSFFGWVVFGIACYIFIKWRRAS